MEDLISERNDNVIINLEDYGGGRITIQNTTMAAVGTSVDNDTNGDLMVLVLIQADGGSDGIFIL